MQPNTTLQEIHYESTTALITGTVPVMGAGDRCLEI